LKADFDGVKCGLVLLNGFAQPAFLRIAQGIGVEERVVVLAWNPVGAAVSGAVGLATLSFAWATGTWPYYGYPSYAGYPYYYY
jgi:hypothetical protein